MNSISDVVDLFKNEFGQLANKFNIIHLSIPEAMSNGESDANSPGVYVFWHNEHGVVKVGKSQDNSKKRSLQHIADNTRNDFISMETFKYDDNVRLLLLNINSSDDLHWVLSLEAFMEWNSSPAIKSARMG